MPLIGQAARWHRPSQTMAVLAMCVILIVVFSVSLNGFLSFGNLFALARNMNSRHSCVGDGGGGDRTRARPFAGRVPRGGHRDRDHRHERRLSDRSGSDDWPRAGNRDRHSQRISDFGGGNAAATHDARLEVLPCSASHDQPQSSTMSSISPRAMTTS